METGKLNHKDAKPETDAKMLNNMEILICRTEKRAHQGAIQLVAIIVFEIAALATAFVAGMEWQSRKQLKEQEEMSEWLDRSEREAQKSIRQMSNRELLEVGRELQMAKEGGGL